MNTNLTRWRDPVLFTSEVLHDPETGERFTLYPAERDFLRRAFEQTSDGRMKFTELLFSAPKKSGKTALAAMIAIYTAVVLAPMNGELYCLANDAEQSQSRVFAAVLAILDASPLLKNSYTSTANKITFRATNTTITALASDYRGFAGANPTLNVYDEGAYYTSESARRLWDEGVPSPARKISFRLSVSTAGFEGENSPLRALYDRAQESGIEVAPDTRVHENLLCYWAHEAKAPWQSSTWIAEMQRTLRAAQFRRLIQNEWAASEGSFVELAEWDRCTDPDARPLFSDHKLSIWIGLDLGLRHDATAVVAVARDGSDRLRLIDHRVFVPRQGETLDIAATAEQAIRDFNSRFIVRAVLFDPWQGTFLEQRLQRAGVNMIQYNQTVSNLTEMAGTLLDVIKRQQLVLYPSADLRDAVSKTVAIESSRGWRLGKAKQSDRVDPVIALAMAVQGAVQRVSGATVMRAIDFWSGEPVSLIAGREGDLPNYDVGFVDLDGKPLGR